MQEKVITLATPVFFLLIAIELAFGALRGRNTYRVNDAVNSISLGILSQVTGVFTRLLRIGIYAWTVQYVALLHLPAGNPMVWLSGLLLYDLCYYWLHRCGHQVAVLWAAHVVHHQSEDYNLSTALRQTSSGALLGWIFYMPMAILGFPVEVFGAVALIDLLYQFWIHTEHVGRLGWFDRVFASPSNHRVHHAVNDRYLDRNFGGILIVWDRLFGTFQEELDDEPIVYGTRSPLRSWNPLWANVEVYSGLALDAWHARRWRDKVLVWFKHPGWRPSDVAERFPKPAFRLGDVRRFDPAVGRPLVAYVLVQFTLLVAMTVHLLDMQRTSPLIEVLAYVAYVAAALTCLGGLLEGRRGFAQMEALRWMATLAVVILSGRWPGVTELTGIAIAAGTLIGSASLVALWIGARGLGPPASGAQIAGA